MSSPDIVLKGIGPGIINSHGFVFIFSEKACILEKSLCTIVIFSGISIDGIISLLCFMGTVPFSSDN
jgi:hypothetical protein